MPPHLPDHLPDGFAVDSLGALGLTRHRLDGLDLLVPSRGLRVRPDADDYRAGHAAAVLAGVKPGSVICGTTAAHLWGLPLPPWLSVADDSQIEVAAVPGGSHADRPNVRGRRLVVPPDHRTAIADVAVTTVPRTWLDCAADLPLEYVVAMGDFALHRHLTTEAELDAMLHWAFRRRGVGVARRARPILDHRAESPGESRLRALLVVGGVPRPECNRDIIERGEWLARADLAWPEQRVIVEYDGVVHLDEKQRRKDATRRNLLQECGWLVIVVTADQLAKPWVLTAHVNNALRARTNPRARPQTR